jgi:hypothetical protein
MARDAELVASELNKKADDLQHRGEMLERQGMRITAMPEKSPALMFFLADLFRKTAEGIGRRVEREDD